MAETKLSSFKDQRWSLQGMTALVTGGTRGIGHAIVEELAEFGASVHICARNQEDINKCLEEWKGKGFCVTGSTCDLLFRDQREKLMETVASAFDGKLNIIDSKPGLFFSVYAASKGAMNQCAKNFALEWAKDNIRANVVAPGAVMTLLFENAAELTGRVDNAVEDIVSQTPSGRIGEPKDISGLVVFLCLPAASHITGQIIAADGEIKWLSCDEGMIVHDTSASIQGLGGPMTRARTKKAKEALTQLVAKVLEFKPTLGNMEGKMVMCIKPLEEGWGASLAAHFT